PRDGRIEWDAIAFHDYLLSAGAATFFDLRAEGTHLPRARVDDLVITRETWLLSAEEFAGLESEDPRARLTAALRLFGRHRLPRFVFAKVPNETKPLYV